MDPEKFAKDIFPLTTMNRYNNIPHIINESVAAHSYQVSIICISLHEEYKNKLKYYYDYLDLEKMLLMSMLHDIPEVFTGDIPYLCKKYNKTLKSILDLIEKDKMKEIMNKKYFELFEEYQKQDCPEAILVKMADLISAKIYAEEEVKAGNTNLIRVIKESKIVIKKYKKEMKRWMK